MFARAKSTVTNIGNKIGFGAGWVAGYATATGKKIVEKTGEAVQATTALTCKTVNQVVAATASATKTTTEKVTAAAKTSWKTVKSVTSAVLQSAEKAFHAVGQFCLRNIERAVNVMLIAVGLMLTGAYPAATAVIAAALYQASVLVLLLGLVYLAVVILPQLSADPSVA